MTLISPLKGNRGLATRRPGKAPAATRPRLAPAHANPTSSHGTSCTFLTSLPPRPLRHLGKRVDMTFPNLLDAWPHINDGALDLGVGSSSRSYVLPNIPTLSETLPGVVSDTWYAIVRRRETPARSSHACPRPLRKQLHCPTWRSVCENLTSRQSGGDPPAGSSGISEGRNRSLAPCDHFSWIKLD